MNIAPATSTDKLHGDEGYYEYSAAEQLKISARALELRDQMVVDPVWWQDTLGGHNPVSETIDEQMPRLMANLDNACNGDRIALDAITAALHQIQKAAKREAKEESEAQAEKEFELAQA